MALNLLPGWRMFWKSCRTGPIARLTNCCCWRCKSVHFWRRKVPLQHPGALPQPPHCHGQQLREKRKSNPSARPCILPGKGNCTAPEMRAFCPRFTPWPNSSRIASVPVLAAMLGVSGVSSLAAGDSQRFAASNRSINVLQAAQCFYFLNSAVTIMCRFLITI